MKKIIPLRWLYPVMLIIVFLALVNIALLFLPHFASVLTGIILKQFHLPHLTMASREIRSESIYVLISFGTVCLFSRLSGTVSIASLGWQRSKLLPEMSLGFFLLLIMTFVSVMLLTCIKKLPLLIVNHHFPFVKLIILYLLTAIAEETVFRGYVFQMAEAYWGTTIALCISSVLFGLEHLVGRPTMSFLDICLISVFGGMTYGAAFAYTRRLWLPIGLHWGDDFSLVLLNGDNGASRFYSTGVNLIANDVTAIVELFLGIVLVILAIQGNKWHSFQDALLPKQISPVQLDLI